jgi:hypothetical protein
MELLFAEAAGVAGLPLSKRVCNGGRPGPTLIIVLVVRHMRLPFALAIRFCRLSQRVGVASAPFIT